MTKMAFSVECVRKCLIDNGRVFTVRGYNYDNDTAKFDKAWTTVVEVEGVGICERILVDEITKERDLTDYVEFSGFKNTADWWKTIRGFVRDESRSLWLYEVTLEVFPGQVFEPLENENSQPGNSPVKQVQQDKGNSESASFPHLEGFSVLSPEVCAKHPGVTFVFGDNLEGWGKAGQACIRDCENSIGIPTKRRPSMDNDAFFSDKPDEFTAVRNALSRISKMKHIGIPTRGIGTGLAKLPECSPRIYELIRDALTSTNSLPHLEGFSESLEVSEPGPEQVCFFPSGEKMKTTELTGGWLDMPERAEDAGVGNGRPFTGVNTIHKGIQKALSKEQDEIGEILAAHPDCIKHWHNQGLQFLLVKPGERVERDFKEMFRVTKSTRTGLIIIQAKKRHPSVQLLKEQFVQIGEKELWFSTIIEERNRDLENSLLLDRESEDYKEKHSLLNLINHAARLNITIRVPGSFEEEETEERFNRAVPSPMDNAGLPLYEYAGASYGDEFYQQDQANDFPMSIPKLMSEVVPGLVSPLEGR